MARRDRARCATHGPPRPKSFDMCVCFPMLFSLLADFVVSRFFKQTHKTGNMPGTCVICGLDCDTTDKKPQYMNNNWYAEITPGSRTKQHVAFTYVLGCYAHGLCKFTGLIDLLCLNDRGGMYVKWPNTGPRTYTDMGQNAKRK